MTKYLLICSQVHFITQYFLIAASTDDDKIIRYHWEQVSGPLDSLANIDASDLDKPMLVLKGLGPGSYRFK